MSELNLFMKRRILSDDIVEYLIDSIVSGNYKPGDKIVETRVSKELKVSQGAVREAIRELRVRGFLTAQPYKGTQVRTFTREELQDYYIIRSNLEGMAIEWGFDRHDGKLFDFKAMNECFRAMKRAADENDIKALRTLDLEFHALIVQGSGSDFLMSTLETLGNQYWFFMGQQCIIKKLAISEQVALHDPILEALKSGDGKEAAKRIREHFFEASEFFTEDNLM